MSKHQLIVKYLRETSNEAYVFGVAVGFALGAGFGFLVGLGW
jgi:hypothetical protein